MPDETEPGKGGSTELPGPVEEAARKNPGITLTVTALVAISVLAVIFTIILALR